MRLNDRAGYAEILLEMERSQGKNSTLQHPKQGQPTDNFAAFLEALEKKKYRDYIAFHA